MNERKDPAAKAFLFGGVLAISYGVFVGPLLSWALDWEVGAGLYIVCIAVGLLAAVLGVGRMRGWSDR